jgi:hypothetical protein
MLRCVKGCLVPDISGQRIVDITKCRTVQERYINQPNGMGKMQGRYEKFPHFLKFFYSILLKCKLKDVTRFYDSSVV